MDRTSTCVAKIGVRSTYETRQLKPKAVEQDLDPGARERKFPRTISKDLIEEAVFGPLALEIREKD